MAKQLVKKLVFSVLGGIIPDRLKRSLLHLSYNLSPYEFEKFSHTYCLSPSMRATLISLAQRGLSPTAIVDVGAYEGRWSETAHEAWPASQIIMIEANRGKLERLSKISSKMPNSSVHFEILGATDGEIVQFNVMETGSSVMNENSPLKRIVEKRSLATLDSLKLEFKDNSNFLKIDVQGYELEVLKGAEKSLPAFEAVLLESAIIGVNEGTPLLHEVISFMEAKGFIASEIPGIHRRPLDGALSQVDIVFLRKNSPLLSDTRFC